MTATLPDVAPLGRFRHVTVLTGAGVSVASGLPTYRGPGGIYNDRELEAAMDAASLPASLPTVWQIWGGLFRAAQAAGPNAAHRALADAEAALGAHGGSLTVLTTNVDGLHTAAGSGHVVELHGRAGRATCLNDWACRTLTPVTVDMPLPPPCRRCGGPTRPAIVLFGERLPAPALRDAERAARRADLFLSVGTSSVVWPANQLAGLARAEGAMCVSLTADPLPADADAGAFDHVLVGRAEVQLPAWVATGAATPAAPRNGGPHARV